MLSKTFHLVRLPLAAMGLMLAVLSLTAVPAGAHQSIVEQGDDYAVTDSDHRSGAVCDWESDGHAVYAIWYDANDHRVGIEEDGGDGGCDSVSFSGKAETVRVCEFEGSQKWCEEGRV